MNTKKPRVSAVVAIGKNNRAIGKNNTLLWHIPDDLKRFKSITLGHPIIMGRKTFESILNILGKPLPGRKNIVVTRQKDYDAKGADVVGSLDEALVLADKEDEEEIFIGGGQQIYEEALPLIDRLYLTKVESDKEGDVFFPDYSDFKKVVFEEKREYKGLKYKWMDLER